MSHMGRARNFHGLPRCAIRFSPRENRAFRQMPFDSARFAATLRAMSRLLLAALLALTLAACARGKPKSTAHMYEGNAPTIKFSDKPENAGGHLNTY